MLIQGQLHLCLRKVHPNIWHNPSLAIRILLAVSSKRSIAQGIYAVVICFIHFATTPSTNLSIPLSLRDFPLSDPGAVALVSSQSAPEYTTQSLMAIRILQAVSS